MKSTDYFKKFVSLFFIAMIWIGAHGYAGTAGKPDLVTTISDSPDPVEAGKEITYRINISNSSSDTTAKNIHVTFSSGVTFVSGSNWSCNSPTACSYSLQLGPGIAASELKVKRTAPASGNSTSLTVTALSAVEDGNPSNNSATATTTVEAPKKPKLKITKTADKTSMNIGDIVTFTLKAQNTGEATAKNTKITDTVPNLFTIQSYSGCSKSGRTVTCTIGNLNAGNSKTYTIKAKANASGDATNKAKVSAGNADSKTDSVSLHVKGAKLSATNVSAYNVASGEITSFKYQVKNKGDAAASNTYLYIDLDDSFSITDNGGCSTLSGKKLKCGPYNLSPGSSSPEITVKGRAPKVSSNKSYKTVYKAHTSSGGSATDISTNLWKTVYAVKLLISKKANPRKVSSNGKVTFEITVTNDTGATVSGITLKDTLKDPYSGETFGYIKSSLCTKWQLVSGTCSIGTLGAGSSKTVTIDAKAPSGIGSHKNRATTTSAHAARSWSDDATVEVQGVDLKAKLVCTPYVAIGGNYNCRLFIEEENAPDITDATLSFTFPENSRSFFRKTVVKDGRFTCSHTTGKVTCTLKSGKTISQADGAVKVASVRLRAFDEPLFVVTDFYKNGILHELDISTTLNDGNSANDHATYMTYVRGANPSVLKTGPVETGKEHNITYTIHVENWPRDPNHDSKKEEPSTTATNISIIDTLPSDVTFVKAEGTGWSCGTPSGNQLTCTYAQNLGVAPDDRVAEDLLVTVKTAATLSEGDKITNLVKVSNDTKELRDLIMRDNTSELNTTIKGAMLETSVTSSADSVMEGDNVVFGFRVKNSGFTTAKNVRIRFDFDKPELVYDLTAVNLPSECRLQNKSVECNTAELSEGEAISATVEANVTDVTGDRNLTARVNADASNTNSSHAEKTIEIDDFATYAEWHFDECRISEGVKEENGDFNGKINGEVEKILDGKLCTALDFLENENGENSVSTDVDLNDLGANGTIAFWFKSDVDLDTYTPNHMHILFDASSRWRYFYLGLIKSPVNGEVYFNLLLMDAGGKNYILYPEVDMRDKIRKGEWHHIAYTFDTATHDMNIYLDGEKLPVGWYTGSSYSEWKSDLPDTGGLHIGGKANNKHPWGRKTSAAGAIDEFKIFDPLLDPETIKSIYNNEKNGKNFNGTSRTCPECTTETSVTIEPLSKIYADNDFEYRILVENNDIFPVNEINLTVDLDAQALYMESNYTTDWSCSHDEKAHRISCYFDADGNASTKCQKGICGEFTLKMRAPNSETTLTSSARITTYPKDGYLPNNEETNVSSVLPVDISISKTTDNNEPDQNQPYLYTLHISNDSGIAKNVTVTDEIESTLSITSIRSNDADWTCSTIGHTILCERAALPAVYDGDISIMVTPAIDKAIHNEANITTETAETNLGNNTAAVDVNVKSSTGAGWDKSKFKDFNLRKNRTFYGDLMVIGNSYLTGQYSDGDKLADVNTTVAQGNISEAELTLQPHMKVEFARLYWTGHLHGESGDTSEEGSDQGFKTIDFHTPDGQTHTLEANESDTFYYYYKNEFDTYRRIYSTSVDVTDIMKDVNASRGTFSGYYGVEGIKANTGKDIGILTPVIDKNGSLKNEDIKFGHFAGWNLVIFYEVDHRAHREQVYKNINIFDGFKKLIPASVGYEKLTIPVSGFITPKFGDIDSRLSLFAAGGEKTVELDSISIVSTENNISSEVKISDALNPEENVLNGTISRSGSDVTARRPHQNYNIGIDLDQFDISSDFSIDKVYFGHLQEETNITLSVGRKKEGSHEVFDQSFLSAIGISTQIYNPDFIDSYKECFVEDPQSGNYKSCSDVNITRGGEIIYRITIINTGDDRASNVVIQDPLPAEVDFNISTADLKVVTDTKPLCAGLDTRADSINSCVQHLESKGVLDHRKLTDTGKEYIRTFFNTDINASSDRLIDGSWNTGFSDYSVTTETIDEEERTKLTLDLSSVLNQGEGTEQEGYFPALNVTWVEFKVKVNTKAILNKTFGNTAVINFTNPTLAAYGYPDATQRQESTSVESPPVVFQWTALSSNIKDPSRNSVGTKIVGKPFDLNISIDDANSTFGEFAANYPDVNLTIWRIRLVDGNNSYVQIADFNRSDFTILSQEYLPIGNSMSWLTDKNISLSTAWRDIYFNIQYKIRYNDGTETKEQLSPNYYGPFGDNFAIRPEKLVFSATNSMGTSGGYLLMKAAKPFDLDVNATDASGSGSIIGYTTHLSATDITDSNVTAATVSISDQKGCIPDILNKIHLYDFNFTNGAAQRLTNVKFDDVGFVTLKVRDTDWTHVDSIKGDCNSTIDNEDNDQNDSYVSCFIKGEGRIIFIPDRIEVNMTVTNQGGGFTYMADDLDAMRTAINTVIRSLNTEGNVTQSFTGGCYADDVNMSIDANISSAESSGIDLLWKLSTDAATSLLSNVGTGPESILQIIDDSSFSNGVANISFLVDVNRTQETVAGRIIDHARYPVDMNINAGKAHIDDYLSTGTGVAESVTNYNDSDHLARFWYARAHAPDYRSNTAMTETPVFIEVFCDNSVVNCANYGISGFPESSDDVNWWINTGHSTSSMGLLYDMNATQKNTLDPYIKINGGSNTTGEINASFTGGVYTPTITYTGTSNLYKTKIEMRVSDWLKYNRINITLPMAYHVEFNLPSDDWSGIGEKGETVETNGNAKSNRRLEW